MNKVASELFDGYGAGALFNCDISSIVFGNLIKVSQTYRERVKSCGVVPNWKDRTNMEAKNLFAFCVHIKQLRPFNR